MSRLLDRYQFDLSDVRLLEGLFGERLPDLLEPLRHADADVEAIRAQIDEYSALAGQLQAAHDELSQARESQAWQGEAAEAAREAWDTVLTVLKWIAAVILFIVAALLVLSALVLIAIAALCELIATVLSWIGGAVAVLVVLVAAIRFGRGSFGRAAMTWEALKAVSATAYLNGMDIVEDLAGGFTAVFEIVGKGLMWLGLLFIELGGDLVGQPSDGVKAEREQLF
ncbi:hypothetical protein [Allorhizocola rhizosphaerae]|uniref:hypothetical protein n=1 Tax=Allorhizocola rhizosphaerae TaxID=1872709 RepID=UPI000E3CBC92|nr:hypothetical protein [Allorhizocola rhizosphaerae]